MLSKAFAIGYALFRLEDAMPEGWVYEMGDGWRDGRYWAQALGPEEDHKHPSVWGYGETLDKALWELVENLKKRD